MTVRKILVWPNPELSKRALPVEHMDEGLQRLIQDLFDTMTAGGGIGLAATQIGVHQRVIVLDLYSGPGQVYCEALINPEIQEVSQEQSEAEEGCLSVPGQYGNVSRPLTVKVKYIDPTGEHKTTEFQGLLARCVLHEIDHLGGRVFVQYLGKASRDLIRGKMKKIGSSYLPKLAVEPNKG